MRFHLSNFGSLEQFTRSDIKKNFRKTKAKSVSDAVIKINKYLKELK